MMGVLELADRYQNQPLLTLCELYASKMVERRTSKDIVKSDVDVIGLLLTAQAHHAKQLEAFCLHFISTNFRLMQKREEWNLLEGENLKYVTEHQWPPASYWKELEEYEKLIAKRGKKDLFSFFT
jgi:Rho family protein